MPRLPSEPSGNIAGVTAIFTVLVITAKIPAAMRTNQTMYAITLHFGSVRVPPIKSAFIRTECFRFGFLRLFELNSAVFAYIFVPCIVGSIAGIELAAPTERFYSIRGKTE